MSQSIEDYLKGILILKGKREYSNKNLAEYLNISPASVSEMIRKLEKEGYLIINKKEVTLTERGEIKAKGVIRRHRVWEVFLADKLGYSLEEIHDEAEILEHVTSEKLLRKLEKFLFYPQTCPHGGPIIYDYNNLNPDKIRQLSEVEVGDKITILKVEDNIELYDYLKELNVQINEKYVVKKIDPFNGPIYMFLNGETEKIVAYEAAKMVEVYVE